MIRADDAIDKQMLSTSQVRICLDLLEETVREAEHLIAQNEWGDEGWRIIFAYGLAYLKAESAQAETPEPVSEQARLLKLYADADAMYSVLKFRAYLWKKENVVLNINVTGLRGLVKMNNEVIGRLRREIAELKAENARLEQSHAAVPSPV